MQECMCQDSEKQKPYEWYVIRDLLEGLDFLQLWELLTESTAGRCLHVCWWLKVTAARQSHQSGCKAAHKVGEKQVQTGTHQKPLDLMTTNQNPGVPPPPISVMRPTWYPLPWSCTHALIPPTCFHDTIGLPSRAPVIPSYGRLLPWDWNPKKMSSKIPPGLWDTS